MVQGAAREEDEPRPSARRRIAWEARKRTSIETRLRPSRARLDDPSIFETPLLYLAGDAGFADPNGAEVGGPAPASWTSGVRDHRRRPARAAVLARAGVRRSMRRLLQRSFPTRPLRPILGPRSSARSTCWQAVRGRLRGERPLEGIERQGRMGVVYSRADMGGAWSA
ncbi:MAG: hypothetical protein IPH72_34460 [Sandaracinaceae bacterium]|nr:hypothetical protein [Sandaracinaceae bacterium]